MPTVPRYSLPQVEERPLTGVRSDVQMDREAFGGGEALQNFTREIGRTATAFAQAKDDADQSVAKEAFVKAKMKKNQLTYGDVQTNTQGYLSFKGKSAFEVSDKYMEEYTKYGSELEGELNNEEQKSYFRQLFNTEVAAFDEDLKKHTFVEAKSFQTNTSKALISQYQEDAVLNYSDMGRVQKSMLDQEQEIRTAGEREGLPISAIDMQVKESHSATHSAIARRYMNNNDDINAKRYFDANKDDMTAKDRETLEKEIGDSTLKGQSQRMSDTLFTKHPENMSAAIEEAKKISEPELRDETVRRVKDNYATKEAAERMDTEDLHRRATDIIDKTGDTDQIPPQDWARFSLSERSSLKSYAENRKKGVQPTTDWDDYYSLKSMASAPQTKDKYLKLNLMTYRNKMADAEFKELVNLQTGLRNGDERAEKLLDGYRTDNMIVNDALNSAGFDTSGKASKSDVEQVNRFRKMVDDQIIMYQRQTGKKATNDDVQRIVDNLMVKGVTDKGFIWDTKKRLFEVDPGESFELDIDSVPKSEKAKIEEALRRRNIPVTDATVLELYKRKVGVGE